MPDQPTPPEVLAAAAEHESKEALDQFWNRVRGDRTTLLSTAREAAREAQPAVIPDNVRVHIGTKIAKEPDEFMVAIDGRVDGSDQTYDHHTEGGGIVSMSAPTTERSKGIIPLSTEHPKDKKLVVGTFLYDPDFVISAALFAMGGNARVYRHLENNFGREKADQVMADLYNASVACDYLKYPDEDASKDGRAVAFFISDHYFGQLSAVPEFAGKQTWQAAREFPELYQQKVNEFATDMLKQLMQAIDSGELSSVQASAERMRTYYAQRTQLITDVREELAAHPEQKHGSIAAIDVSVPGRRIDPLANYEAAGTPVVICMNQKTRVYNPIGVNPAFYERLNMLPAIRTLQAKEIVTRAKAEQDEPAEELVGVVNGWLEINNPKGLISQLLGRADLPPEVQSAATTLKERGYLENLWGGREVAFGSPMPGSGKYSGSLLEVSEVMDIIDRETEKQLKKK